MWEGIWKMHKKVLARYDRHPDSNRIRTSHPTLNAMAQMTDVGVTWSNQEPGTQAAPLPPTDNIYDCIQAVNSEATDQDQPKLTTGFLRPLWELGFTDLRYITSQDGKRFLTLSDLPGHEHEAGTR